MPCSAIDAIHSTLPQAAAACCDCSAFQPTAALTCWYPQVAGWPARPWSLRAAPPLLQQCGHSFCQHLMLLFCSLATQAVTHPSAAGAAAFCRLACVACMCSATLMKHGRSTCQHPMLFCSLAASHPSAAAAAFCRLVCVACMCSATRMKHGRSTCQHQMLLCRILEGCSSCLAWQGQQHCWQQRGLTGARQPKQGQRQGPAASEGAPEGPGWTVYSRQGQSVRQNV
jgi:hypothetical protein